MKINDHIELQKAKVEDIDGILKNYQRVYGKSYPITYGNDPDLLKEAITNHETHDVCIARDLKNNFVVGALILEKDNFNHIGKLLGLVVLPEYQKHKIGHHLVSHLSDLHLDKNQELNSLYATTRTVHIGAQKVFIKNDFLPLGLFPNAHRLSQYETVTLFAKFRAGILNHRQGPQGISKKLAPIYACVKNISPLVKIPNVEPVELAEFSADGTNENWEFEVIQAPHFVLRKFLEVFPDPADRFFPFHTPNMLLTEKKGRMEIFAYFSKRDGYCALIKTSNSPFHLHGQLTNLYLQLHDIGVTYMEVLINTRMKKAIETFLRGQFLPSAIYPAMRQNGDDYEDYIVMSRSMEPLNFKGMSIIPQFKPYIDQYIDLWKQVNLETLEIIGVT